MLAKQSQRLALVLATYEQRDIIVASAVADHAHRDIAERIDNLSLETAILPLEIAHHADDHHIAINGHSAKLLEIVEGLQEGCVRCRQ